MLDNSLRYKLKSDFVFLYDEEHVYIYNYKEEKILVKIKVPESVRNAMKKIDGVMTIGEVLETLDSKEEKLVCMIIEKYMDVFFERCNEDETSGNVHDFLIKKYVQNNMGAFKKTAIEMIEVVKNAVSKSKIVIVGCGILGSDILSNILEFGIKNIVLVDSKKVTAFDSIWAVYTKGCIIGDDRKKVIKNAIEGIYSNINIETYNTLEEIAHILDENTYCIVCEDNLNKEMLLYYNDKFLESKSKWVSVYIDSEKISVGPTIIPNVTGCLNCSAASYEFPENNGFSVSVPHGYKMASSILTYDLLNYICDVGDYLINDISVTLGKQFIVKLKGLEGYSNELLIDPKCKCSE